MNAYAKTAIRGLVLGATLVSTAFAGVALRPVSETADNVRAALPQKSGQSAIVSDASTDDLAAGEVLAGASKISLEPRPEDFEGAIWEKDPSKCTLPGSASADDRTHVADWRTPWIENTNCIYMGGYGLGPSNPIVHWDDQYGLWVRTTVITDADGDSLVLILLDAEGYFGEYNRLCGSLEPRCGAFDLAEDLAEDHGFSPDAFVLASTHAHTAMDYIGGWGGVPDWYMDQTVIAIKDSVAEAFANRTPATLEVGEDLARGYNSDRRKKYWAAEDPTVNWFRALDRDGKAIATVAAFATHPVNYPAGQRRGHADWPGAASAQAEANNFAATGTEGVATFFQAGLGNMTGGGSWEPKGKGIANVIPASGTPIANPDIRFGRTFWDQPVTNGPLGGLGAGGFFDRPFGGPATVTAGRSSQFPCRSASPVSVKVNVVAAKIGTPGNQFVVTSAPGEIFANFSNVLIERSGGLTTLALGQANDALGYMPQFFESDYAARQGLGFAGAGVFEYEDAYSIDHCFGDAALTHTFALLNSPGLN